MTSRAAAAPPFDQAFARQLGQGAAHGDARDAMIAREVILSGKTRARRDGVAENAVAQHQVDLPRLGLAQSFCHAVSLASAAHFTWYYT